MAIKLFMIIAIATFVCVVSARTSPVEKLPDVESTFFRHPFPYGRPAFGRFRGGVGTGFGGAGVGTGFGGAGVGTGLGGAGTGFGGFPGGFGSFGKGDGMFGKGDGSSSGSLTGGQTGTGAIGNSLEKDNKHGSLSKGTLVGKP